MCPPAASSSSFGELGPVVPSSAWRVVGACEFPPAAVGRPGLVVVDGTASLDRRRGAWFGEGARQGHGQWWRRGRLWCEGLFGGFSGLAGQRSLAAAMTTIALGHVGVIHGTVIPEVGVPLGQDAVGVVAVHVGSRAPATPVSHFHAVETKPLCRRIRTHHVAWTTPSDDNCRRAVDGT
jgi:hypothetical protein